MKALFARLVREDAGQDLIEYGILIGLITVAIIAVVSEIGPKVEDMFSDLNDELPEAD